MPWDPWRPRSALTSAVTRSKIGPIPLSLKPTMPVAIYGSGGYCQIRPITPEPDPLQYQYAAVLGNDLGVTEEPDPSLLFAPPVFWVAFHRGGAGSYVNYQGYSPYLAPDGTSVVRQGALSVPVSQGPYNSPAGDNASRVGVVAQFTVATAASFRLGIAVDSVGTGSYAPDYISVFSTATGTVFSTVLIRDGTPEMAFFDLTRPSRRHLHRRSLAERRNSVGGCAEPFDR